MTETKKDPLEQKSEDASMQMQSDIERLQQKLGEKYQMMLARALNTKDSCQHDINDWRKSFLRTITQTQIELDAQRINKAKFDRVVRSLVETFSERVDEILENWNRYVSTIETTIEASV